jgi:hypothetical protein
LPHLDITNDVVMVVVVVVVVVVVALPFLPFLPKYKSKFAKRKGHMPKIMPPKTCDRQKKKWDGDWITSAKGGHGEETSRKWQPW